MRHFVANYTNKIDAKGRVSVPHAFRQLIEPEGFHGVFCGPAFGEAAIDGYPPRRIDELAEIIEGFDPFTEERRDFGRALLGSVTPLPFDGEGRIVLPDDLREHAGIKEAATFVGMGDMFQIWQPAAYLAASKTSKASAETKGFLLKRPKPSVAGGAP